MFNYVFLYVLLITTGHLRSIEYPPQVALKPRWENTMGKISWNGEQNAYTTWSLPRMV